MTKIEYTFGDYVKVMHRFFSDDKIIAEAIKKTARGSKRSVVNEVLEVRDAINALAIAINIQRPRRNDPETEGRLNPFSAIMVEVDHGILVGNRIRARKMKNREFVAYYFGK